jgi:hypothetical protein
MEVTSLGDGTGRRTDLKTPFSAFSTTSETYQKLPKKSFKPMTGVDFSPISEAKAG